MRNYRNTGFAGRKRQSGMTLMELLVAGMISVIVSSAMVILMANTMGTSTGTIKTTALSAQMRTAMLIMSRELRRANYHATYAACFGDLDCLATLGVTAEVSEIEINAEKDCFWFWYDRPQRCPGASCTADQIIAAQTAITAETVAGFRRTVTAGGTGSIQMTTSGTSAASCPTTGWVDITNPELVDITFFEVTDAFEEETPGVDGFPSYTWTVNGTQSVERLGISMRGKITDSAWLTVWKGPVEKLDRELTVSDFVRVRNNVLRP